VHPVVCLHKILGKVIIVVYDAKVEKYHERCVAIMKRTVAWVLVLFCLFPSLAFGEGKLSVVQKNLLVFAGEDSGYFYAKVQNTGDKPIGVDTGTLAVRCRQQYSVCYGRLCKLDCRAPREHSYIKDFR
jgi:hypothetical protein